MNVFFFFLTWQTLNLSAFLALNGLESAAELLNTLIIFSISKGNRFLLYFSMSYRDFSVKSKLLISMFQTVKLSL